MGCIFDEPSELAHSCGCSCSYDSATSVASDTMLVTLNMVAKVIATELSAVMKEDTLN